MKVIEKHLLAFVFNCLATTGLSAQNTMTSSPHSMFGLGEMAEGQYGQNASMGSVSIGMRDRRLINVENPAGLTAMDTCSLLAEVSAFIKSERYDSNGSENSTFTGNFSGFTLGGRILRRWYAAAGILPYSSVGYYFHTMEDLEGESGSYVSSTFEGLGGLSKAFLSQGFALTKHLSIGANLNFIFGDITQSETRSPMVETRKSSGNAFFVDFGAQFHRPIGRETYLTLGLVYSHKQKIVRRSTTTVTGSDTETTYEKHAEKQYLPPYIGIGGTLTHKKWSYALDYRFQQYSVIHSDDSRATFQDSHELRLGLRFAPGGFGSDSYWKRMAYKIGTSVTVPYYLGWRGKSGNAYRVSAGLEMPLLEGKLNTALFYDHLHFPDNTLRRGLIGFTVSYTLSERLYRVKL